MFDKFKKKNEEIVEEINLTDEQLEDLKDQAETIDVQALEQHGKHYSENKLWNKIKKYSKKIGSTAVYAVLLLFYVMQKEEVPKKNKAIIIGALGYFILPFDFIPDVLAGVGYTDDIGVLLAALWQVSMYIDDDVKNKAKAKLKDWFGDDARDAGTGHASPFHP